MRKISENIENNSLEDASAPSEIIQETDAEPGGRWEDYVRTQHQKATQGTAASVSVRVSNWLRQEVAISGWASTPSIDYGVPTAPDLPLPPVFDSSDDSDDSDEEEGMQISQVQVQDDADESDSGNIGRHDARETGNEDRDLPPESGSEASSSDSDDDGGINATEAEEEEVERMSKLFEDFPTTIDKSCHVDALDEEYGTTAISQEPRWKHIAQAELLPRVRAWFQSQFNGK